MQTTKLFTPLKIRDVEFPNRMGVPPMCMYGSKDGYVSDVLIGIYADYAMSGFGGIIQEATAVVPEGRICDLDLGIWKDDFIPGLKRIVDVVHVYGAKIGIQLAHAGRKGSCYYPGAPKGRTSIPLEDGGWEVVGPTAEPYSSAYGTPHALTKDEIKEVVDAFAAGARRAVEAGYDFIQLHGAHGFLLHEFLSPLSNTRTDEYGGSYENRTRLLKEVVTAVRAVIPAGMPLFVRLSMSDFVETSSWDLPEVEKLSVELTKDFGVDMINFSSAGLSPLQKLPREWDFQLTMAEKVKKDTGVVCSAVGGVADTATATRVVDEMGIEVVEVGKAAIRHAFSPRAVAVDLGQPIPPYREEIRWASRIPQHVKYWSVCSKPI
ncbi:uncharacterized protein [Blastocystis hominis]|uniref:NADH:flavin oxidoreductase/NADH oxidase N-terminal domain-containing protein n=1 Tax=Blastocystis hominis TaxID=12968 RepID=D8M5A9_BLAHO|nr:uncharacterized protein [Blastocystis hominis]CBK23248.2 unnamed protein product [Blastocystis hominis]|eukprot:XP_012897296.1 uncharacterized protein [Blastocystis hominis]